VDAVRKVCSTVYLNMHFLSRREFSKYTTSEEPPKHGENGTNKTNNKES
jgi:hypothetical protein